MGEQNEHGHLMVPDEKNNTTLEAKYFRKSTKVRSVREISVARFEAYFLW